MKQWSHGWVGPANLVFFTPQPAVGSDGTIYANIGNLVFAFKPGGNVKWAVNPWNLIPQSPLPAADGTVYVFNWRYVANALRRRLDIDSRSD